MAHPPSLYIHSHHDRQLPRNMQEKVAKSACLSLYSPSLLASRSQVLIRLLCPEHWVPLS